MNAACQSCQSCQNCMQKDQQIQGYQMQVPQLKSYVSNSQNVHKSNHAPEVYTPYAQIPTYLGGNPGTEQVILYKSAAGNDTRVEFQKYDEKSKKWTMQYEKVYKSVAQLSIDSGYWEAASKNVVVIYYMKDKEGYLNYTVIGRRRNRSGDIYEIISRNGIYQGSVWLEGGRLYESEGNRYRTWMQARGQFALIPHKSTAIQGAKVINYSIDKKGHLEISEKTCTITPGAVVQFIRTDNNPVTEKMLYSSTAALKFLPHKSAFRVMGKGEVELAILPDGRDWNKGVSINIEAK